MGDFENNEISNLAQPEINFSTNTYCTKVFGIQKTDQVIQLNESFGFRVKIELESHELLKNHRMSNDPFIPQNFNYENTEFFIEADLIHQKCKLCNFSNDRIIKEFDMNQMVKCQTIGQIMHSPVKGLSKFFFLNFKDEYLSQ